MSQSALTDLSNISALCVDDDPVIRSVIRFGLQHHGCHDFLQARNGPEALEICADRNFSILIVDFQMTPMNGLDFLRELAGTGHGQDWPVIMLSAETNPDTVQEALALGVREWIGKPVSVQSLIERIGAVLHLRGLINLSQNDPGLRSMAERHHTRLVVGLGAAEHSVQRLTHHPREIGGVSQDLHQILDDISEHARTLNYGLVTMLAARTIDLVLAMARNPGTAARRHAAAAAALGTLVTAMKRIAHNRMEGDGGEAGLKLLEKIDGLVAPVRTGLN